jgi:hypothetical protein
MRNKYCFTLPRRITIRRQGLQIQLRNNKSPPLYKFLSISYLHTFPKKTCKYFSVPCCPPERGLLCLKALTLKPLMLQLRVALRSNEHKGGALVE